MTLSVAYMKALAVSTEASVKFSKVKTDYRARKVDDAVFVAAFAEHKAAQDAFDVAFAAEAAR